MSYLVIYHKNCTDGLAAALAVRKWLFENQRMRGAKFQTAQYGQDDIPSVVGKDVVIVDFSYKRPDLLRMYDEANNLVVLDHHQTAEAELGDLDFATFDNSKSGAVLAWEHFFPDKPLPKLMEYVQDRDLWRWELPFSREVSAALRSYKPFLNEWERFLDDYTLAGLIAEGAAILRNQQRYIDMVLSNERQFVRIGDYNVPCVNSTTLISEIGEALNAEADYPFVAMYFDTAGDKRVFSLRSTDNGIDVSEVAKQYGGGGHRNAAGFTVDKPEIIQ